MRPRTASRTRGRAAGRPRVLVVGQVPPPHHGQAIMVETLLRGRFESVELVHVDASYSSSLDQVGRVDLAKVVRMGWVVARTLFHRFRDRAPVLYYHPAGANRSAVIRDVVVLTLLRPFFRSTVFHHHARGLPAAIGALPCPIRALARRSYRSPDLAIAPSEALLTEAEQLRPARAVVVPNGTEGGAPSGPRPGRTQPRILFLNVVSEAKGAHWLLRAVSDLHARGLPVDVVFAGDFPSPADREAFVRRISDLGLDDHVELPGVVVGRDKWEALASADVFCVPTTYEQESFGLAMVEAASCGLAVVATDVPGPREVFRHGETALLADPARPETLTDLLVEVCSNEQVRQALGARARRLFEDRYTAARFWRSMDDALAAIGSALDDGARVDA